MVLVLYFMVISNVIFKYQLQSKEQNNTKEFLNEGMLYS